MNIKWWLIEKYAEVKRKGEPDMDWVKNLLALNMSKGKSWVGGLVLIGLGAFLIATGEVEKGVASIGSGAAILGIADKIEKSGK